MLATRQSISLVSSLEEREFELARIEEKLSTYKGARKLTILQERLQALLRENLTSLLGLLSEESPVASMLLGQYTCRLELYPAEYESGSVFEVIGQVDLFVWIQRSGNSYFAGRFLYGKLPAKYRSLSYFYEERSRWAHELSDP